MRDSSRVLELLEGFRPDRFPPSSDGPDPRRVAACRSPLSPRSPGCPASLCFGRGDRPSGLALGGSKPRLRSLVRVRTEVASFPPVGNEDQPVGLGRSAVFRRTLKGNKAHGRIGRRSTGNGRSTLRTRWWSKALNSSAVLGFLLRLAPGNGRGTGSSSSHGRNGRKATTAVTRCGCQRGEFFEGFEQRREERARCSPSTSVGAASGHGKRGEPQVGSRMQQACDLRAAQTVEVVRNHEGGT
jgi:hypothetical protein